MGIFKKFHPLSVPEECKGMEIRTESSVCTGERIIGFYDPSARKLLYAQLAQNDSQIADFYRKYGLEPPGEKG